MSPARLWNLLQWIDIVIITLCLALSNISGECPRATLMHCGSYNGSQHSSFLINSARLGIDEMCMVFSQYYMHLA